MTAEKHRQFYLVFAMQLDTYIPSKLGLIIVNQKGKGIAKESKGILSKLKGGTEVGNKSSPCIQAAGRCIRLTLTATSPLPCDASEGRW